MTDRASGDGGQHSRSIHVGKGAALPACSVEIVETLSGLDALEPEWCALQDRSGASSVFQSHALVSIWARHFLDDNKRRMRLHVVVVRSMGRAVLILPLVITRTPVRIAHLAGDPIGQYAGILLDPDCDAQSAFDAALASAAKAGAAAIILRRLRDDAPLRRFAAASLRPATAPDAAPFADLSGYRDYEAYLQSLSKSRRKKLRNRRHRLEKAGNVAFEILAGGAPARSALDDAIGLKRNWLIHRGAVSTAFLDPATRTCLLDLAEDHAGAGAVVMRMLVDGEPAAIRFGFEYQGTYCAYLSAYDERFAELSPGTMLMDFYLSQFRQRGLTAIDMLPPTDQHKSDWCPGEVGVADYVLPLTALGRIYGGVYQEQLRPALRRVWLDLPDGVRSMIVAILVAL